MNTIHYSFLTLILTISLSGYSQKWGHNTESAFTNEALDVEIDASGNNYVTGYITGETAFDPTVVEFSALGNGDVYVAKYAPNGNLIWIKKFGGSFSDRGYDLAIGPDQNIVVTGQFFGTVNFGSTTLNSVGSSKDIFLAKLDPSGNVIWARQEGGSLSENAYGVTVDNANNVILTGQFQGTATVAGQSFTSAIDPLTGLNSYDLFISKYDSNGNPQWVKNGYADYEDRSLAVHTDASNNIFMTGQYSDTLVFAGQTFLNSAYNVGFLAKFSPSGSLQFFNNIRAGFVLPYDVEVNALGEAVVIGDFLGNILYFDVAGSHSLTNPYEKQVFALKTDNNGGFSWGFSLGSDNDVSARSVSVDSNKDIYLTGYFKCGFSQLRETDESIFYSVGFKDPYLVKINNTGTLVYAKQLGGKKDDEGHGVAIKDNDEPVICGSYTEDLMAIRNFSDTYTTAINHFKLRNFTDDELSHIYLFGDQTRNSFLTNVLDNDAVDYNYYFNYHQDTLIGSILPNSDTLYVCLPDSITYFAQTYSHLGPLYDYLWNTGDTTRSDFAIVIGNYNVRVERDDECLFDIDSVIVQTIDLPTMHDNLGSIINQNGNDYYEYEFCAPDSVQAWFENVDPTNNFTILYNDDTISSNPSAYYFSEEGYYYILYSDENLECIGRFHIDLQYAIPPPPFDPYIVLYDTIDYNDSILVCEGNQVQFLALDAFTNPTGLFVQSDIDVVYQNWTVNGSDYDFSIDTFLLEITPNVTGWYVVNYDVAIGYDNLCGIDTVQYHVTDSFYIEVAPLPNLIIHADNLLCPNGSVYLYIDQVIDSLHWSGPGIDWISSGGDSIQATAAGIYRYWGTYYSPLGCTIDIHFEYTLYEKPAPSIGSSTDYIICPNDSILLTIPDIYLSYDWNGPTGGGLSNTDELYASDQGFYYVHVLDDEGCYLTSPPYELLEFTTPYLTVEPSNTICNNEDVTLTAIHFGDATVQWFAPLNTSNDEVIVNQAGTYLCEIQQCGLTFLDSIIIIDGSFTVDIQTTDSVLCHDEQTVLVAPSGLVSYIWNGDTGGSSSYTVSEFGNYWVTVMNNYGCEATSDTIHVDTVVGSTPPIITGATICPGGDVTLYDNSPFTTNWYENDLDSAFIITQEYFSFTDIIDDTTILVSYQHAECPPAFGTVTITVIDSLSPFVILGDSMLCPNEQTSFSVQTTNEAVVWLVNNISVGTGNSISINQTAFIGDMEISAVISNTCFSDTISQTIYFATPETINIVADSLIICAYDVIQITATSDVESLTWSGNFGSETTLDLTVTAAFGNGNIIVSGIDLNGCATNSDTVYLTTSTLDFNLYSNLGNSCIGDSISFGINSSTDSLVWTTPFGTTDTTQFGFTVSNLIAGIYSVQLWDEIGCIYSDSITIVANTIPVFNLGTDTILCLNEIYSYFPENDGNFYSWSVFGTTDSINVIGDQNLMLTAFSPEGCVFHDTIYVAAVNCDNELPNVFTPNGDGINDFFFIDEALLFPNNRLVILNRWGNVVLDVRGYQNDFNGDNLSDGVYFFAFFRDPNNEPNFKKEGFLTLIRN